MIYRLLQKWLIIVVAVLPAACGVSGKHYAKLEGHMTSGQCAPALEYVSASRSEYGRNARLLYHFDKAMVNLLCGRFAESADALQDAERLAEELWTISVSREASTFLVSEYAQEYGGEDFEKAMINVVSAVDYLLMGKPDEALVECRRLDEKLTLYNDKYAKKNVYKEDAFGRYLSGIIYESRGMLNDAYIDYRKAYEAYLDYKEYYNTPVPMPLKRDLMRLARKFGFDDDLMQYRKSFRGVSVPLHKEVENKGRLVLIQFDGLSPRKIQDKVMIATRAGPITLAFPRFVTSRPVTSGASLAAVSSDGRHNFRGETFLAEDIRKIAVKNLDDRKARVVAKTIVRAVAKQAAFYGISKAVTGDRRGQKALRQVFNIANVFIEQADTRSWRTLPGRVYLSIALVDPGSYRASADLGGGRTTQLGQVQVRAGETRFLFFETMY